MPEHPRTCPCKFLSSSLSSFTAAEYGDIHSLSKIKDVAFRKDDAGYNPLHFTAQFNHVAATAFLLKLGCPVDGSGHSGATPMHRAAFSGATAAMKVLLEWNAPQNTDRGTGLNDTDYCNLLARDTSFGDESTPLHKAAAGGRYAAVHMLLQTLKERDKLDAKRLETSSRMSPLMPRTLWLQRGLEAKDKCGRTPLDLARRMLKIQNSERDNVARWDEIAGGPADWGKCVRLLEHIVITNSFENEPKIVNEKAGKVCFSRNVHQNTRDAIPRLPLHLTKGVMTCLDCNPVAGENSGVCSTVGWQFSFQKAVRDSANMCILAHTTQPAAAACNITAAKPSRHDTTASSNIMGAKDMQIETTRMTDEASANHLTCTRCNKSTIAFYQLPGLGTLVCKNCQRSATRRRL